MSDGFSGAEAGQIFGIIFGLFGFGILCGIIRCIVLGHKTDAEDHQGLPRYSKNCPPENTGQEQGVIQDNEPHLAEQNDESFDEDARTIVGEENESNVSRHGVTRDNGPGLTESNGRNTTEEDKDNFDGKGTTITGEEKDVSSVDLTERGYPGECYDVPKDDGPLSTRKSLGEGNEWTSVDLNENGYPGR